MSMAAGTIAVPSPSNKNEAVLRRAAYSNGQYQPARSTDADVLGTSGVLGRHRATAAGRAGRLPQDAASAEQARACHEASDAQQAEPGLGAWSGNSHDVATPLRDRRLVAGPVPVLLHGEGVAVSRRCDMRSVRYPVGVYSWPYGGQMPPAVPSDRKDPSVASQTYAVTGMTCQHCVNAVAEEVRAIAGVTDVDVALETGVLTVTSTHPVESAAVAAAVDEAGYALST